jgi:hypothetical protein
MTGLSSRSDTICVIGGGWSFRLVNPDKLSGMIITANEGGVLLPVVHHAVSMDRLWSESRWPRLDAAKRQTWLRRNAVQNIDWADKERKWLRIFDCDHKTVKFSEEPQFLNGTNSGVCALNLAYLLRPRDLYLFGFDMCRSPNGSAYWHDPYPWTSPQGATKPGKYQEWASEFNEVALAFASISCRVWNVSESSQIKFFPKVSPKQLGIQK